MMEQQQRTSAEQSKMKRSDSPMDDQTEAAPGMQGDGPGESTLAEAGEQTTHPLKKRPRLTKEGGGEGTRPEEEEMSERKPQSLPLPGAGAGDNDGDEDEGKTTSFATLPPAPAAATASASSSAAQIPSQHHELIITQTFPQRLMEMLDNQVVPDAMWWAEGGKAFALDLSKFEDVLHNHFQATKYASFTRKLNKWGFRKLNNIDPEASESVVVYRHELFQQDKPELLTGMSTKRRRKDKKGKDAQRKRADEEEDEEDVLAAESQTEEDEDVTEEQDRKEEEKGSPYVFGQSRRTASIASIEAEAKADSASESKRQEIQHHLSMASNLASQRISDRHLFASAVSGSPQLSLRARALQLQGLPLNPLRDERERLLMQSLISAEAELRGRQDQSQLQQYDSLTSEMIAQRQLAASASAGPRFSFGATSTMGTGSFGLDERGISALQDPAMQGFQGFSGGGTASSSLHDSNPIRSASLPSILPSGLQEHSSLADIAATLRYHQSPRAMAAAGLSPSLNPASALHLLHSQSMPELRSTLHLPGQQESDLASIRQLMAQNPGLDSTSVLELLSRGAASPGASLMPSAYQHLHPGFSDNPSLLRLQLHMEQLQQQERQAAAAAALAANRSHPLASRLSLTSQASATDQQLLQMILDRQRLEAQMQQQQQEQQRRRQYE